MTKAVFPGTFDPTTYGHLNIIERVSRLFDEVDVVVSVNPEKKCLFSEEERVGMMKELTKGYPNVTVHSWNSLIADYCKKVGASVLVRGIRNSMDFSYEFDLALMNKSLCSSVETLFLPTLTKYFIIRSSSIKEAAKFGGDVSAMVPPVVEKALKEKFSSK